jgi:hypothetical protein
MGRKRMTYAEIIKNEKIVQTVPVIIDYNKITILFDEPVNFNKDDKLEIKYTIGL